MADDGSNGNMDTSGGQNDDDRKLFAGGLAQEATEKDIKDYFAGFGEVASVNLMMDQKTGRSRGFAYVVFNEVETLNTVLTQDHAIKGKNVAVKKAEPKEKREKIAPEAETRTCGYGIEGITHFDTIRD